MFQRRTFLRAALALPLSAMFVPRLASGDPELRALWVDAFHAGIKSSSQIDTLIDSALRGGINALFVQVRRRGDAYYQSSVEPRSEDPALSAPPFDPLGTLLERIASRGVSLEVHAWIASLPIWSSSLGSAPTDPAHVFNRHGPLASGDQNWLMRAENGASSDSEGIFWLDPAHPAVIPYTASVVHDLLAGYPALAGLHLDRIRYPQSSFGYNPLSVERFNRAYARSGNPAPDDAAWKQWRRDQVTALLLRIALVCAQLRPDLRLSAALIASDAPPGPNRSWEQSDPYNRRLQDWHSWLTEGLLDTAVPMNYDRESVATQAAWFRGWVDWELAQRGERSIVVGQAAYLNSVPETLAQLAYARSAAGAVADGVACYAYSQLRREDTQRAPLLDALRAGPFASDVSTPGMPWKARRGAISGSLASLAGQLPLDGTRVTLSGPVTRELITQADGWFGATNLPPGNYLALVKLDDRRYGACFSTLAAGGTTHYQQWKIVSLAPQGFLPRI